MNKLLEIKNLRKQFDDDNLEVLKDISFSVNEGDVISILGPSGSGKTTLLRCATMLEKITSGEIIYMGEKAVENDALGNAVYAKNKDLKRIQNYIGLVFQNFNLFPHYNVMKNIMDAPVNIHGRDFDEAEAQCDMLLEKMGLSDKKYAYPYQLSGGQQQRVAIARALAMNPKILFFDEPTSALDPELTGEILKVIRELAMEKMTMVIVTHEINFAREVSNRVIFMENGVVVEDGTPQEVIDNPKNERTKEFLCKFEK